MKGDFSRQTYRPAQSYSGVLMQQGRVQLDADWNEEHAIQQGRIEAEARDVIGQTGTPKPGGFGISVAAGGQDLLIGAGHYYVDGILCVLDPGDLPVQVVDNQSLVAALAEFENQPFAPNQWIELRAPGVTSQVRRIVEVGDDGRTLNLDSAAPDFSGAANVTIRRYPSYNSQPNYFVPFDLGSSAGRYLLYLDVWERHVTQVEDPALHESALHDEDTTTRLQTIWQVKSQRMGGVSADGCDTVPADWQPTSGAPGQLRAWTDVESAGGEPCTLPPTSGYTGLENQLYRVEVHVGGTLNAGGGGSGGMTFKWSRDNGTVLTALESGIGTATVTVQRDRGDDALGFIAGQTVEVSDDLIDLNGGVGALLTIADNSNRATRQFTLSGSVTGVSVERHAKLRRWDGTGDLLDDPNGIPLENGILIEFLPGEYHAGDYWLIPARAVTTPGTGMIEWAVDDDQQAMALPPQGVAHHYAALALVNFDGSAFLTSDLADCRKLFPPLTAITAGDVSYVNDDCQLEGVTTVQEALDVLCALNVSGGGACDIVVDPAPGWEQALLALADNQDANICFGVGTYPLGDAGVEVTGKGNLKITGCGSGTQIVSTGEKGLLFKNCPSVLLRDLSVTTQTSSAGATNKNLNGAITVLDCPDVVIENVRATCAAGSIRAAAGITVRNAQPGTVASARILHNDVVAGHLQVGILVINVRRVEIEDNSVRVADDKPNTLSLLNDYPYRASLRKSLISNIQIGAVAASDLPNYNARVTLGNQVVVFKTDSSLTTPKNMDNNYFQKLVAAQPPPNVNNPDALRIYLEKTVDNMLLAPQGNDALAKSVAVVMDSDRPAVSQGIVVAGSVAEDVRILHNTITSAIQGIHVGLSHSPAAPNDTDTAQIVQIARNTVHVRLPSSATRERHGIFVGNSGSLLIESNFIDTERFGKAVDEYVEGVRVYGWIGRRMMVRENHMVGVDVGVRLTSLNRNLNGNLWIITENLAVQAAQVVRATSDAPNISDGQVRSAIRGVNDNFA